MAKIDVYNLERQKVGEIELADAVFATDVKEQLLHEVVVAQLASRRAGTHAAKERSAVAGSKKKLYRQKGTGNARHGSIGAPIYVGGGRAHPPRPQDWSYRPPRRVRQGALCSALSLLLKEGRLTVVDEFQFADPKTKRFARILEALRAPRCTLVVDDGSNQNLKLSIRNLERSQFLPPEGVNVYDLLRHEHLLVSRTAAKALEARCLEKSS